MIFDAGSHRLKECIVRPGLLGRNDHCLRLSSLRAADLEDDRLTGLAAEG